VFDSLPPGTQMTQELLQETLRSVSQSDKDIREKVQQLKVLYSKSTDETEHHIFRRCSNAKCEKVESKEKKFKVCAGCLLATYCSEGKPYQFEGTL
jgi:phage-related tail protein